jgi:hypothetical protein
MFRTELCCLCSSNLDSLGLLLGSHSDLCNSRQTNFSLAAVSLQVFITPAAQQPRQDICFNFSNSSATPSICIQMSSKDDGGELGAEQEQAWRPCIIRLVKKSVL